MCGIVGFIGREPAAPILLDGLSRLEYARPITVGDNVWFGGNVTVLPGVTIGSGAVVGGGSVVSRDVPPNTVAVGNPCRVVKEIFQGEAPQREA